MSTRLCISEKLFSVLQGFICNFELLRLSAEWQNLVLEFLRSLLFHKYGWQPWYGCRKDWQSPLEFWNTQAIRIDWMNGCLPDMVSVALLVEYLHVQLLVSLKINGARSDCGQTKTVDLLGLISWISFRSVEGLKSISIHKQMRTSLDRLVVECWLCIADKLSRRLNLLHLSFNFSGQSTSMIGFMLINFACLDAPLWPKLSMIHFIVGIDDGMIMLGPRVNVEVSCCFFNGETLSISKHNMTIEYAIKDASIGMGERIANNFSIIQEFVWSDDMRIILAINVQEMFLREDWICLSIDWTQFQIERSTKARYLKF